MHGSELVTVLVPSLNTIKIQTSTGVKTVSYHELSKPK